MWTECLPFHRLEFDNLIKFIAFWERNGISGGNGSFAGQVPLRVLAGFHHIVVGLYIRFQVAGLGSKPDCGSISQISGWWMEMFT